MAALTTYNKDREKKTQTDIDITFEHDHDDDDAILLPSPRCFDPDLIDSFIIS